LFDGRGIMEQPTGERFRNARRERGGGGQGLSHHEKKKEGQILAERR